MHAIALWLPRGNLFGVVVLLYLAVNALFLWSMFVSERTLDVVSSTTIDTELRSFQLWPRGLNETDDRILDQMRYGYVLKEAMALGLGSHDGGGGGGGQNTSQRLMTILLFSGVYLERELMGRQAFIKHQCPVDTCYLTNDWADFAKRADAVIMHGSAARLKQYLKTYGAEALDARPPNQVWIAYSLESPQNNRIDKLVGNHALNWSATYRTSSTIVAPYEKFVTYGKGRRETRRAIIGRNYAEGKTKMAAMFVSNCNDRNGRIAYAKALREHISVDIYGSCGPLKCRKSKDDHCLKMLRSHYKFYLAFENSNCKEYITEKFFTNALEYDVVPIVMGARPDDYRSVAPPGSYIHVDDFESPRHLADYLVLLHGNDTLYNQYFRWKGTGEFINTKFWCRLCTLLHTREREERFSWYPNIQEWWQGRDVCVAPHSGRRWSSWRQDEMNKRNE